jgi:hypothetical protein
LINVNFRDDWKAFLENDLTVYDLKYEPSLSLEDNVLRYFNAKRRIPPIKSRAIHESKELYIPRENMVDYSLLKKLICDGEDIKPYLSRDIVNRNRADRNDKLLDAWGFQHLHFRPEGTTNVLFVKITDSDIYIVQATPHGKGHPEAWVNRSLLEIMHNNWPEMAGGTTVGIQGEHLTATQMIALRKQNGNFAVTVSDGTVYVAPGGGTMASGYCFFDLCDVDRAFADLDNRQRQVEANEASFRTALSIPLPQELTIRMIFADDGCWLYEPTKHARITLTIQQEP